jgi:hypothetical protein
MGTATGKSFSTPDEVTDFPDGQDLTVRLNGMTYSKSTFEPGWRWSTDIQPIVQTDSCQFHHRGYVISGRLGIRMNDGTESEYGPDTVIDVEPGHEGWVIGDEPLVMLEINPDEGFGKPAS